MSSPVSRRADESLDLEAATRTHKPAAHAPRRKRHDPDESDDAGEEPAALLAHRCVYLSCPLLCSGVLLFFFLRFLFYTLTATANVAPLSD